MTMIRRFSGVAFWVLILGTNALVFAQSLDDVRQGWEKLQAEARKGEFKARMIQTHNLSTPNARTVTYDFEYAIQRSGDLVVVKNLTENRLQGNLREGLIEGGFSKNDPPLYFLTGDILPFPKKVVEFLQGNELLELKETDTTGQVYEANARWIDLAGVFRVIETPFSCSSLDHAKKTNLITGEDGLLTIEWELLDSKGDLSTLDSGKLVVDPSHNYRICSIEGFRRDTNCHLKESFTYDDGNNSFACDNIVFRIEPDNTQTLVSKSETHVQRLKDEADSAVFSLSHYGLAPPHRRAWWAGLWPYALAVLVGLIAYRALTKK